ncbi:regulator of nonsense transcripts 3A isoform X6 [Kogia breviceps]|uniref:regulator of nonsense transcripts 3A isoform X6 n=1 Tax=Kogia breviceps TaxID=27615 RepID=UPI0034D2B13F
MRSEEGEGGPGVAVTTRCPSGKEKPSLTESHFRRESQRREPEAPVASSSGCGGGAVKPREGKRTVLSKVVIRRLPPSLTKEQLGQQLHPLPAHDYFVLVTADLSLYPHLYSRAYINFRNPDDILLFRDRFDGYIFTDSKGLEYPAVVEFAPFQKTAKKKLKKKDTQTGSIEDDPEYKKFLETYCVEEEKTSANPETLLGDIEAKTRELIARRTTPLLEYIKNRKLEKQRIREEKRGERRRRELERKRLQEEEIRRRREEEKCKRRTAEKQKKTADKEVRMKVFDSCPCHPNQERRRSEGLCCQACELANQISPDTDSKNNPVLLSQTLSPSALNIGEKEKLRDRLNYDRPAGSHPL